MFTVKDLKTFIKKAKVNDDTILRVSKEGYEVCDVVTAFEKTEKSLVIVFNEECK
jgi:hypothetical protein